MTNHDEDVRLVFEKKADERLLKALKAYSKVSVEKMPPRFSKFQEQLKSDC